MKFDIRLLYLYLFSFVGLFITTLGGIQLVDLGLKTYVFHVEERGYYDVPALAEENQLSVEEIEERNQLEAQNERKRDISNSLAMMVVGIPLYLYHWRTIKQER